MKNSTISASRLIAVLSLAVLLITVFTGCAPKYDTTSDVIPEGWEVVSTEGNVKYLHLKEGSDAYHWVEFQANSMEGSYATLDVVLPGNPNKMPVVSDANGNVNIIVYYGYMLLEKNEAGDGYSLSDNISHSDGTSYGLGMSPVLDYLYSTEPSIRLDSFGTENTLNFQLIKKAQYAYQPSSARMGYTQAVMIAIPLSEFTTGWDSYAFGLFRSAENDSDKWEFCGYNDDATLGYCKFNDTLYFHSDDLQSTLNSFPYVLLTTWPIVNLLLLGLSILLTVIAIRKKWIPLFHLLPCLIAIWYNGTVMSFYDALPYNHPLDAFGPVLITLGLQYLFGILIVLLPLIYLFVHYLRRRKERKQAQADSTPQ